MAWFELLNNGMKTFLLVMFRVSGIFVIAPFFSHVLLPKRARIILALMITASIFKIVQPPSPEIIQTVYGMAGAVLKELTIGIVIGYAAATIFSGISAAGQLIGRQMAFGIARMMDMTSTDQSSLIAVFINIIALLLFLCMNGHHWLIKALAYSYKLVPINGLYFARGFPDKLLHMVSEIFEIGVKVAGPAMAALFLSTVALALMARAVPQMNVFFVGLPMKIFLGLISVYFCMPFFYYIFQKLFKSFQTDLADLLYMMG